MGNAVKRAAQNAVEELLKVASLALEVPEEKLEFKDGRVWVKDSPHEGIPIDKLPLGSRFTKGAKYPVLGNPIIGKGHFTSAGKEASADPETGQAVSGRTASATIRIALLSSEGLGIPQGVADGAVKPWLVQFDDINGVPYTFKVKESIPDRAIGAVSCILEFYK